LEILACWFAPGRLAAVWRLASCVPLRERDRKQGHKSGTLDKAVQNSKNRRLREMQRMKHILWPAVLLMATSTIALAGGHKHPGPVKSNHDLQEDREDIKRDRFDIKKDKRDIQRDKEKLEYDLKYNQGAVVRDRADLRADYKDLHKDYQDLRKDLADYREDLEKYGFPEESRDNQ
jgi:hypothetical protein